MNSDEPHYVLVPRKIIAAHITVFVCLMVGIIAAFQYANYVDRQSNHRWCGLVELFLESYVEAPPTTRTGIEIQKEMLLIEDEFNCGKN